MQNPHKDAGGFCGVNGLRPGIATEILDVSPQTLKNPLKPNPAEPLTHGQMRAPERAALSALVRAPRECRRSWWVLYTGFRRDREQAQRWRP